MSTLENNNEVQLMSLDPIQLKSPILINNSGSNPTSTNLPIGSIALKNNSGSLKIFANIGSSIVSIDSKLSSSYAASSLENEKLEPKANDTFETAIGKLHKATLDNEETVAEGFSNLVSAIGLDSVNQSIPDFTSTNYLSDSATIVQALIDLDAVAKDNDLNNLQVKLVTKTI